MAVWRYHGIARPTWERTFQPIARIGCCDGLWYVSDQRHSAGGQSSRAGSARSGRRTLPVRTEAGELRIEVPALAHPEVGETDRNRCRQVGTLGLRWRCLKEGDGFDPAIKELNNFAFVLLASNRF